MEMQSNMVGLQAGLRFTDSQFMCLFNLSRYWFHGKTVKQSRTGGQEGAGSWVWAFNTSSTTQRKTLIFVYVWIDSHETRLTREILIFRYVRIDSDETGLTRVASPFGC